MNDFKACPHAPDLRATVSVDDELVLTRWHRGLPTPGGPAWAQFTAGPNLAGIFDLRIDRVRNADGNWIVTDLQVIDIYPSIASEEAHQRMVRFAADFGFDRVWVGGAVVVPRSHPLGGIWHATCQRCGAVWTDSSYEFWLNARAAGYFPLSCSVCSHPLEQKNEAPRDHHWYVPGYERAVAEIS